MASRTINGKFTKSTVSRNGQDERTGQQNNTQMFYNGFLYANGGSLNNPMGFPGYESAYLGTYDTYRWMLQHPVLRLVRAIAYSPILASVWEFTTEKGFPENWLEIVKSTFTRIRTQLIEDFFINGKDMGWACGEIIWEYKNGIYDLKRVKPLLQDKTDVMVDKYGNVQGLRNYVHVGNEPTSPGYIDLSLPVKGFTTTYDSTYDNVHGRSWLESSRATSWKDWLDCAQQLQKLGSKISGTVTVITSPAGTFPGPTGTDGKPTQVSYQKNAEAAIKALASGAAGVWFPSLGLTVDAKGNIDAMKVLVELAGKSLTNIEVMDFGGQSQAIEPILERMKHAEELMFNAGLRSARVGLEAKHGTKAEAGEHTDTGTIIAETEDEKFAGQCQPLLDQFIEINFSPNAVGKVRLKAPSLIDKKTAVFKALLLQLTNNEAVVEEMCDSLDVDKMINSLDVPIKRPFSGENVKKSIEANNKKQMQAQKVNAIRPVKKAKKVTNPQGGRPTSK